MDLTTLTDNDLHDLSAQISTEWERRRALPLIEQGQAEVVERVWTSHPELRPGTGTEDEAEPWTDPGTDHLLFAPPGAYRTHQGRVWHNMLGRPNHYPPGTLNGGWVDVTPPPVDPETGEDQIIPWGEGQAVKIDDLRTHDGQTWRAKIDHVTHEGWAPSPAAHAVWEPVP